MRKIIFLVVLSALLFSCAGSVAPQYTQAQTYPVQLVAQTEITNVWRFSDGMTICWFTESRYTKSSASAGGIVCR